MPEPDAISKNLQQYEREGFIGPLKAFEAGEMNAIAAAVLHEIGEKNTLFRKKNITLKRRNRHLDWDVAKRLTFAAAFKEIASEILGPQLVLWRTNFFISRPGGGIRWHRDEYNQLLSDGVNHVSMHLAITEAPENNCIMLVPGSHTLSAEQLAGWGFNPIGNAPGYGTPNFWRDDSKPVNIVKMVLKPGEYFVFHPGLIHASYDLNGMRKYIFKKLLARPKKTGYLPRIGFAIRITTPENKVLPAAFAETVKRGDYCVVLS